ncbi:hypothetical protein [Aliigemmobacter aestuarii]|nr:hypothetical protein [Gemmobacter aestuarii]
MLKEIKSVLTRSPDTLAEEAAGVVSLFALLAFALYLPGLL